MKLDKAIIEQMEKDLAKVRTLDDMLDKNGLIKNLIKALSEQILEEELSAHLGIPKAVEAATVAMAVPKSS